MKTSSGSRVHPSDDLGVWSQSSPVYSRSTETSVQTRRTTWLTSEKDERQAEIDEQKKKKENEIVFIREHFHQKECKLFIPKPEQFQHRAYVKARYLRCHCGEIVSMHDGARGRRDQYTKGLQVPSEFTSLISNPEKTIRAPLPKTSLKWTEENCMVKGISNAFGRLDFNVETIGGKKPAKYVRVSDEDSVDDVLELMTNHWGMMDPEPPSLVISVVGGAKNFQLDGASREIFNSGLIKAAKSTKAWLITSGGNMGVMKAVGQAVHKGQSFVWLDDKVTHLIRCIGISPWGYVKDRQRLENPNGLGRYNAYHRSTNEILHDCPVPLNPYHTHFVFVDNGYRVHYGGVASFRANLEKRISTPVQNGGLGLPLVQILLEGGVDAIHDVSATVAKGTPVIVCDGSGRAANMIAYAYKHTVNSHGKERGMSAHHQDKLARKLYAAFPVTFRRGTELEKKQRLEDLLNEVIGCCRKEELITVFNLNKHEELDLAILSVLLKGRPRASSSMQNQLQLAMTWDRADIAQTRIFREDVKWEEGSLENAFTYALIENKHEFVRLLLNHGVIMREYLTRARLQHLYNSLSQDNYLHIALKNASNGEYFTIDDITAFLTRLLDKYEDNKMSYSLKARKVTKSPVKSKSLMKLKSRNSLKSGYTDTDTDVDDDASHFKQPYKQLLVWAVLNRRKELARLFWELGDEPIMSALVASRLCGQMESKLPKYLQTIRDSFHDYKMLYERLAISVLDECHSNDPQKAVKIVERPSPVWSQLKCLQVATAASNIEFVSSVAVQNSINNVWKQHLLSHWPKVFLGAIFPPAVIWGVHMGLEKGRKLTRLERFVSFYTSPLTKFTLFNVSYSLFLALFSYMLLVDFKDEPSATEYVCMLWIVSIFIGAIHAFLTFPSPTIGSKLRDYFGSMDRLDLINLVLAFSAFFVRLEHLYTGKVIYCCNAVIFYIRVMKIYTGNRNLGPKIYMINKMIGELMMFVMVLVVFLLAYGVASQGLLYKHRSHDWVILKDILYFPYWQLYGEIFLEEIETDDACTARLESIYNGSIPDADNSCRTYHPLVPILLALYLLVGNILLLSILIAIFSAVFEQVTQNAIEIWKFQMYFLVMEFVNRPALPPPFSLLAYAFYFLRWVFRRLRCRDDDGDEPPDPHQQFLSLFEKEMMANMLRNKKIGEMNSIDMKLDVIGDRLDELTRVVEEELIMESEIRDGPRTQQQLQTQDRNMTHNSWSTATSRQQSVETSRQQSVEPDKKPQQHQQDQEPAVQRLVSWEEKEADKKKSMRWEDSTTTDNTNDVNNPLEEDFNLDTIYGDSMDVTEDVLVDTLNSDFKEEKHKHKKEKKKKKKDKDREREVLPKLEEEKELNIHVPGIEKLSEKDKYLPLPMSDDENESQSKDPEGNDMGFTPNPLSSPKPLPKPNNAGGRSRVPLNQPQPAPPAPPLIIKDASPPPTPPFPPQPPPQRPGIRRRISRRLEPQSDSDEECPIPLHIYSPKSNTAASSKDEIESEKVMADADDSSDEERVVREVRNRLRKHISRRQFQPDLDGMD